MAMFNGRKLIIATKHGKEKVIAPVLEKEVGVTCLVTSKLDTDIFGTFTGEVEREFDPISTARQKCLLAMELSDCDLGIASEGSFGPHPVIFFTSADEEWLLFIDKKNKLEIIVRELSTVTNFNGKEIRSLSELLSFARLVQFPSHGLIIRKSKDDKINIIKGITEESLLIKSFNTIYTRCGSVYVETDMRALYNPTRMSVIENATEKLVTKLKSGCPQCNTPGFDITQLKRGLPCNLCGLPTNAPLSYSYTCQACHFTCEELYPHKKVKEDPAYCDFCNP